MPSAGQVSIARIMIFIAVVAVLLAASIEVVGGSATLAGTLGVLVLILGSSSSHLRLVFAERAKEPPIPGQTRTLRTRGPRYVGIGHANASQERPPTGQDLRHET